MALPLGKLSILIGAGILGSVLAKEGRLPNVSDFVSGAFKIAVRQVKQDDSTSSVRKPRNDSLMAQVNSLREELQMLASSRPVTIVTQTGTGATRYSVIIVVVVVGYGYVWWKGWKLPDMMFATRRGLSDACTSMAKQLENVYSSIKITKRQLSKNIDSVDSNLKEVAELTANTQEKVNELRADSEKIGHDVLSFRNAVETLELKINRIEGKQELTNQGVKNLCYYAYSLENNFLDENIQASSSNSRITFSKKASLPSPLSEPSSPSVSNGSLEVQQPLINASSVSSQETNGISRVTEASNSPGISGFGDVNNGSSRWSRPKFLQRTLSATNAVPQQTASGRQ